MTNPPTQPPTPTSAEAEAEAGNRMPDPVLAPRALAELRQAFGPSLEVSEEADARVLASLQLHRRKKAHSKGFWRGFQIAAVLALIASVMFYMDSRRSQLAANSPFAGKVAAQKAREKEKQEADRLALADTSSITAPSIASHTESKLATAAPATQAAFAAGSNVTILDVLNLARKAEGGFKPSGAVVSQFDEVSELAAKVVGCKPEQVPALSEHFARGGAKDAGTKDAGTKDAGTKDEAPAGLETETRRDSLRANPAAPAAAGLASPVGETRILTYDIMLDVGSRSLAAFQIEISMSAPDTARVTLMGVRGGDHPALQRQPLFDSRRVAKPGSSTTFTIANFDTGKDLPSGDVRVARIVLVVVGPGNPGVTARLVIAAGAEGALIPAGLRVVERAPITGADLKHKQLEKAVEEAESLPPMK